MDYPIKVVPTPRPLFYFKKSFKKEYVYDQLLNIINKLHPHRAIHILDVASGDGSFALYIREDRVKKQLADEIITVGAEDPIEPLYFSYYQLNVNDKSQLEQLTNDYRGYFDMILGIDSIEYTDNPKQYLYYLQEMLNEDGQLFLSMTNINNPTTRRTFYKKGKMDQFCEGGKCKNIILSHILVSWATSSNLDLMIEYPIGFYPKFWLYPNKHALYTTLCNLRMLRFRGSLAKLYIFKKRT